MSNNTTNKMIHLRIYLSRLIILMLWILSACSNITEKFNTDTKINDYTLLLPLKSEIIYTSQDSVEGKIKTPSGLIIDFNLGYINPNGMIDRGSIIQNDTLDNLANIITLSQVDGKLNDIYLYSIILSDTQSLLAGKRYRSFCAIANKINNTQKESIIKSFRSCNIN